MAVLILAEHDNAVIRPATFACVAAAQKLDRDVHVLVAGADCGPVAAAAARIAGVAKVLHADAPEYAHQIAENLAPLIQGLARTYSHVLAPATSTGKAVMPRLAALLDVAQISEVIGVEGPNRFVRPIYAGNAIATVETTDPLVVLTVRTTAFEAAASEGGTADIEVVTPTGDTGLATFVDRALSGGERPELSAARVVIAGGRGLQSGEHFRMLEQLADKLGGAVGATRAAVDAGFVPNDTQIGQTGKVVAPDLYIAVGVSGAIQHLAGMKDSKVIVAINKDEEAPIFQVADYGLVADLFKAVPELIAEIDKA